MQRQTLRVSAASRAGRKEVEIALTKQGAAFGNIGAAPMENITTEALVANLSLDQDHCPTLSRIKIIKRFLARRRSSAA